MSNVVFTARSMTRKLDHAVCNVAFYDLLDMTFNERLYERYISAVSGEEVCFSGFDEFLVSPEGLGAKDSFVFAASLRAVSESKTNPLRARAAAVLKSIRTLQALPQVAKELQPAGPAPVEGMKGNNPKGVNQHTKRKDYDGKPSKPDKPAGNEQAYIIRRIKRDHPEIAEQLERGEFKSARQAGIAAGFVKKVPTVRLNDPAKAAAAIIKHMGVEWAAQLTSHLTDTLTA